MAGGVRYSERKRPQRKVKNLRFKLTRESALPWTTDELTIRGQGVELGPVQISHFLLDLAPKLGMVELGGVFDVNHHIFDG
jgi:hypothetical protein